MNFTCERLHYGSRLHKSVIYKGFLFIVWNKCMSGYLQYVTKLFRPRKITQNLHDFVNITGCSLETVQARMLGHISL